MYKGQTLNREEYLTGRSIDKNFEQLAEEEKAKNEAMNNPAISVPINHVEHEVIPFSIRQYKGLAGTEQVDMARKLMEDPLMLIKQKEMETRRQILQNPVKLKELHKMLKAEKESQKKKKSKKEKKKKKKHKKSDSDTDESDVDLDKALAEKYKKLQGALASTTKDSDDEEEGNVDKLLSLKFEVLSKELDKMTGSKKKKKKKRDSSSSSDDFNVSKSKNREEFKRRDSPKRDDRRSDRTEYRRKPSRSPQRRNFPSREERRRQSPRRYERHASPRRSTNNRRDRSPPRRDRTPPRREQKRSRTPEKRKRPSPPLNSRKRTPSSSSESPDEPQNYDSDDNRPTKRTFGLVTADGKGISVKKSSSTRCTSRSPPKKEKSSTSKPPQKQETSKLKPTRMTQEEIDARLKEMMSNASWREKERAEKVNKYRENEKREQEEAKKDFDKDFLTKQLKKTANSTMSVESRIKSNLNNIQRSSRTMESNFARR